MRCSTHYVQQAFEQLAEELLRGPLVTPALYENIQHVALLIDRPPQIMMLALNGEKYLIKVPLITGSGTAATELIGILLAKLAAPLTYGLIRYNHTAFQQQFFTSRKLR